MEDNKNLVTEVTENVEQTTEETQQTAKTYTQEEVDAIVGKAKARTKAKIQKENDRKYGELVNTLKAGTGKETVEEINDTFRDFYQRKGIEFEEKPKYTEQDIKVLAKADAKDIINGGFEEAVEEADRLNELGVENMTAREKAVFIELTNYIKQTETSRELGKIGVSEDVYNSDEFKKYAAMFKEDTPISVIYDNYKNTQPKKEIKTMGSMKNTVADSGIKDFYTPEEAKRFTVEDFDRNPGLLARIEDSMKKWRK